MICGSPSCANSVLWVLFWVLSGFCPFAIRALVPIWPISFQTDKCAHMCLACQAVHACLCSPLKACRPGGCVCTENHREWWAALSGGRTNGSSWNPRACCFLRILWHQVTVYTSVRLLPDWPDHCGVGEMSWLLQNTMSFGRLALQNCLEW
jgi:hypothetical protein